MTFVQQFDSVPQFWQFIRGLRFDDLLVELIQNELDAKIVKGAENVGHGGGGIVYH